VDALGQAGAADAALENEDPTTARRIASNAVSAVQGIDPKGGLQSVEKYVTLYSAADIAGHAQYQLGDYAAAEQSERMAVEARRKFLTSATNDLRDEAEKSTWLAMALAREGKLDEAAKVIGPVVQFHRELASKNHGDRWEPLELACALYAEALSDAKQRSALLQEAAGIVDALPASLRSLHDVRQWRQMIQHSQQGLG
jgi:hypothetical protein